jgi:hypothetical protein
MTCYLVKMLQQVGHAVYWNAKGLHKQQQLSRVQFRQSCNKHKHCSQNTKKKLNNLCLVCKLAFIFRGHKTDCMHRNVAQLCTSPAMDFTPFFCLFGVGDGDPCLS